MSHMGPITQGKLMQVFYKRGGKNYNSIKHLKGSNLTDSSDTLLDYNNSKYFTDIVQFVDRDILEVTEKIDGANVGIIKYENKLYPITKSGYDARIWYDNKNPDNPKNKNNIFTLFAKWVYLNQSTLDWVIDNDCRLVFEWLPQMQTIKYNIKGEPIFLLDYINKINTNTPFRSSIMDLNEISDRLNVKRPRVIQQSILGIGNPIDYMKKINKSFAGGSTIEGIVIRYERDNIYHTDAKFVSGFNSPRNINKDELLILDENNNFIFKMNNFTNFSPVITKDELDGIYYTSEYTECSMPDNPLRKFCPSYIKGDECKCVDTIKDCLLLMGEL